MIDFHDTSFYDKESSRYSARRYEGRANNYIQYFFRRRLSLLLGLIRKYAAKKSGLTIIEDGCADGIVLARINEEFPHKFTEMVGTDISPGMIKSAVERQSNKGLKFYIKNELPHDLQSDMLLAVGFVSPGIFSEEFAFIKDHIKADGLIILSLVGRKSIFAKLKLADKEIVQDYWSFKNYEKLLTKDFVIVDQKVYGLFVPKLWAWPVLGRLLQPFFEVIFEPFPRLYQEKLYVLRFKSAKA